MMDKLLYLGATHKTAALTARERLAPGPERVPLLLAALHRQVDEAVVLSTCGRFEVYAVADAEVQLSWPAWLGDILEQPEPILESLLHVRTGAAAASHLLRVSAGLESQIIGEDQILGQVRNAFATAMRTRTTGAILGALFRAAIHSGRRVRHETELGRNSASCARTAVDIIRAQTGATRDESVLIIGSGGMARDVAQSCRAAGIGRLVFASRHLDRARWMAVEFGGVAVTLDELHELPAALDAVIACATVRTPIIDQAIARRLVMGRRRITCPLCMIDLGMPRNIDPAVGQLPNAVLNNLEMLGQIDKTDDAELAGAEAIVDEELRRFRLWLAGRNAAPRIMTMLAATEGLPTEAARCVRRALHGPIVRLKEEAAA